jgi:germination protein M
MPTRRPRSLLATFALLAAATGLAGCGGEDDAVSAGPAPVPTTPETAPRPATPTGATEAEELAPTQADRRYQVWLTKDDSLFLTWVEGRATVRVATQAVELLLEGRGGSSEGVGTAIPDGTRLLGIAIDAGVATVDLSSEFEAGGGSSSMFLRLAQVVYTVTQFPTVYGVRFRLDGEPVEVFSSEGIVLDGPVGRADYEDLLPPLVVLSPAWDEPVQSPLRVYGSANVYEANVTLRLLDAEGKELARTFTTATCGSGCRGRYDTEIPFRVRRAQRGYLVASDDDADGDGTPQHEVRIPVVLEPGP